MEFRYRLKYRAYVLEQGLGSVATVHAFALFIHLKKRKCLLERHGVYVQEANEDSLA